MASAADSEAQMGLRIEVFYLRYYLVEYLGDLVVY